VGEREAISEDKCEVLPFGTEEKSVVLGDSSSRTTYPTAGTGDDLPVIDQAGVIGRLALEVRLEEPLPPPSHQTRAAVKTVVVQNFNEIVLDGSKTVFLMIGEWPRVAVLLLLLLLPLRYH
jgi:hypothetical protein